jgi:adenosine/AMP kinase
MDFVMYTGFGYPMRDILLVRSSEAVIFGCGRIGTIHEFTIAFEDGKPIGVLEGCWQTDEVIKQIIEKGNRPHEQVIFDNDPDRLVKRIIKMILDNRDRATRKKMGWD